MHSHSSTTADRASRRCEMLLLDAVHCPIGRCAVALKLSSDHCATLSPAGCSAFSRCWLRLPMTRIVCCCSAAVIVSQLAMRASEPFRVDCMHGPAVTIACVLASLL